MKDLLHPPRNLRMMADTPPDDPVAVAEPTAAPPSRWPVALRSFRHRDFRLFWVGMVVSVTGTWMQMTAQQWLVYGLTKSALYLGLVGFAGALPMFLFTLPAGVIADRFRRRNIVMVTQTLAMAQAFVLAGLIYWHVIRVWHVAALAIFLGTVNSLDMPTRQAMVLELVQREDALNAVSINSTAFNTGRVVGPFLAGLLIAAAGMAGCFFINALSFLAIIVALAFIPPRPPGAHLSGRMVEHIGDGMKWAKANPVALSLLILTAASGIFAMPYGTLMPVLAQKVFHVGPRLYGPLYSAAGAGAIASAAFLTWQGHRWRIGRLATAGALLFPLALLAVAFTPRYSIALVTLFLLGTGAMLFNAVSNTILQMMPPDSLRGRVMSLRAFVFAGMTPFGMLQIGAVAQWLGPEPALAIGGTVCLTAALAVTAFVPQLRRTAGTAA
jgi:MFS family permease